MEELKKCRICNSEKLKTFLDLGNQPLANTFLPKKNLKKKEPKYPLKVQFCEQCNLCQLSHVVSPENLFKNYVYFSSGMPQLPKHFQDYAEDILNRFITSNSNLVLEIGSNDGILLKYFKDKGLNILGVDPAENIARVANKKGVKTISDFFGYKLALRIKKDYGKAKVIIGNNVVAHINDHHDLLSAVKHLLSKDGVFVLEAPYLIDMFENLTFDTIYHEHLSYLAIRPLKKLFEQFDMEIFDVQLFPVQGQSIRVFAGNKSQHRVLPSVKKFIYKERELKLDRFKTYKTLAQNIEVSKRETLELLKKLKSKGAIIAGYGAPAKGNTLLNYYKIGTEILDYTTEALPSKIGLYTPGTHIPVIDINKARLNPPNYYLLLAWNYKTAIMEKEEKFLKNGGKFIMPIGKSEVIDKSYFTQKQTSKDKVLVTGGSGYIGSILCQKLIQKGYKVKVVDLGIFLNKNIQRLPNLEIVNADVRKISTDTLKDVQSIIHLAGFSTEPTSQYDPRLTDTINHLATERLAQIAKANNVQRFIYASTASIYFTFNTPLDPPLYKETDQVNPISSYSITKRCSEQVLLSMTDNKFRATIFRKGTLYGFSPRMRYDLVFNSFVKDAYSKKLLTVDAGGEIWRPMIDIEDITETYVKSLELPDKDIGGKIFNVSHENWRIGTLAENIRDIIKHKKGINIKLDVKPYGLTRNYKMDNSNFLKAFGFKSKRDMEDALLEIWDHLEGDTDHKDTTNPIFYNDKWYHKFFETKKGKLFRRYFNTNGPTS